jgi:type I restriction enzyme S subunit
MTLRVAPQEIVANSHSPLLAIADDWERVPLRHVAEITNGAAFKSAQFNNAGIGMPLIRIRDVGANATKTFYNGDFEQRHVVEDGDLLIGMDGDFRVARWAGPTALLNQRVCRVRVLDGSCFNETFLEHVLQPYLDAVHELTSAVTVKHLSSKTIGDLPIPLPPLPEQRRIVAAIEEHFSRLDAAEAGLRKASGLAEALVRAQRESVFSGLTDLSAVETFAHDQCNAMAIGPFGSNLKVSDYRDQGVPLVFVRDIRRREFGGNGTRFVDPLKAEELASHRVRAGDVLITKMGDPPGDVAVYDGADAVITADCIKLTSAPDVLPEYLVEALQADAAKRQIESVTRGVAQRKVSLGRFRKLVSLPRVDLSTQRAIVRDIAKVASTARRADESCRLGLLKAAGLRRSVLAAAFSGQLVPSRIHPTNRRRCCSNGSLPIEQRPNRLLASG